MRRPLHRRRFWRLFVLLFGVGAGVASAQDLRPWQFEAPLRTITRHFTMPVPSLSDNTDRTVGRDGVIAALPIASVAHPVWTSSIAALPYPCKLDIKVQDDGNADTLSCTSVDITGIDNRYGPAIGVHELIAPTGETAIESGKVYTSVTRVEGIGCTTNSGDAGDIIRVSASAEVGLPFKITARSNIQKLLIWDASASRVFALKATDLTYDATNNSVETDDLTPTLGNGDVVTFVILLDKKS